VYGNRAYKPAAFLHAAAGGGQPRRREEREEDAKENIKMAFFAFSFALFAASRLFLLR
jgi:hypothetical protein